jgi:hypothetical protein
MTENKKRIPYIKDSETSKAAAESLTSDHDDVKRIIVLYQGGNFTCDEAFNLLGGERYNTISARITNLRQAGILVTTGERRKTSRGRYADILMLAPGACFEWYEQWSNGDRPGVLVRGRWRKGLEKVAAAYVWDPSAENQTTLLRVTMAGKDFLRDPAEARESDEGPESEDDDDFMSWLND